MEESYQRMEESNRQIKSQYETLLKKFEILSSELSRTRAMVPSPGATQATQIKPISETTPGPATSAVESIDTNELGVSLEPLQGNDVEEFIAPYFQPPGSGAQGRIRRGAPPGGILGDQLPGGMSPMDEIGTGTREPAAGRSPSSNPMPAILVSSDHEWIASAAGLTAQAVASAPNSSRPRARAPRCDPASVAADCRG